MNKKIFLIFGMVFLSFIFLINFSSAQDVCCEKTKQGAWCQNDDISNCAEGYKKTPTTCDATAYCVTGTCIDQSEGRCISNTPQELCTDQGGFWDQRPAEEIPSCQIGCCFLENGDTSPVTLTRCKALSATLGIDVKEYRSDITDQFQCLASASSPEKGACVIDNEIERNCKHLTRQECNSLQTGQITTEFSEGYLCTADFLETICGRSQDTTCVEDGVYFLDSCGNIANVYDSSRYSDPLYWNKIIPPEESCNVRIDSQGNVENAVSCGNCNYSLGSYCEAYERGINDRPTYGNYVCSDLGCKTGELAKQFEEENGRFPLHGESWCITSSYELFNDNQLNQFSPGEESYVLRCSNGEVTPESGSQGEWRQKICRESVDPISGVHSAGIVQNTWLDCLEQTTQDECEYTQDRDCVWMKGHSIYRDEENNPLSLDSNEDPVEATCVPKYSPAFDFWNEESTSPEICKLGSNTCVVTFELGSLTNAKDFGNWSDKTKLSACTSNCYCLQGYKKGIPTKDDNQKNYLFDSHEDWLDSLSLMCSSLGDCGTEVNYLGEQGRYTSEDELVDSDYFRKRQEFEDWANSQT